MLPTVTLVTPKNPLYVGFILTATIKPKLETNFLCKVSRKSMFFLFLHLLSIRFQSHPWDSSRRQSRDSSLKSKDSAISTSHMF